MPDYAKDLLIADHKYIGDLFQKSEQGGETRFNIFVTLVTGGIGGIVVLMSKEDALDDIKVRVAVVIGFASLLVIGWVIFLRMIKREIASDRFKRQLDKIRDTFKQHCDGALDHYNLFPESKSGRTFGGLTDTVAVLNGLLAAGLIVAIGLAVGWSWLNATAWSCPNIAILGGTTTAAIVVGISFALFQISYANRKEKKEKENSK